MLCRACALPGEHRLYGYFMDEKTWDQESTSGKDSTHVKKMVWGLCCKQWNQVMKCECIMDIFLEVALMINYPSTGVFIC